MSVEAVVVQMVAEATYGYAEIAEDEQSPRKNIYVVTNDGIGVAPIAGWVEFFDNQCRLRPSSRLIDRAMRLGREIQLMGKTFDLNDPNSLDQIRDYAVKMWNFDAS
jgi:hypothetical protein